MRKGILMSVAERNRYLQILYKNGANRKQVSIIMKDIDESNIFAEEDIIDIYDEDDDFNRVAEILFSKTATKEEKMEAEKSLNEEKLGNKISKKGKLKVTEAMILKKQREYIAANLVLEDDEDEEQEDFGSIDEQDARLEAHARYGRSPLHEAIAYREIEYVKKCIKEGKYLDAIDNNGHTPREMAFYDGWMDAVKLFSEVC